MRVCFRPPSLFNPPAYVHVIVVGLNPGSIEYLELVAGLVLVRALERKNGSA